MKSAKIESEEILHDFDSKSSASPAWGKRIILFIIVAIIGIISGYFLSKTGGRVGSVAGLPDASGLSKGTVVGSADLKTFKDSAEGVLEEGGIEGEGQYHLVRPGGDSQNVYLTSSIVDLSAFKKRKVKVFGQTQKAEKAGWLMDVGRVEVLE